MKFRQLIDLILKLDKLDLMLNIFGGWFHDLQGAQQIFLGIAMIFSILSLIQLLISQLAIDFDARLENDEAKAPKIFPTQSKITFFTTRSLSTFFTFFGWTGFLLFSATSSIYLIIILASAFGIIALVLSTYLLFTFSQRRSQRIQLDEKILFQFGTVRSSIPANRSGFGKIKIIDGKRKNKVRAVTEGDEITPGQRVRVIGILAEKTLLVEAENS